MMTSRLARDCLGLFVCMALWLGFAPAASAGIQISPLQLEFAPSERSGQLTLRNTSDTAVALQVRVFEWSQPESMGMALQPTTVITASPAIVTLAPGATQLVRVLRREKLSTDRERYYRLLLDELPDASAASRNAVQMLTRYSLPIFVLPRLMGQAELSAVRVRCQDNRDFIDVRNVGTRRARLAEWQLLQADSASTDAKASGRVVAQTTGLTGYVLPGGELRIPVTAALPATDLEWRVKTDHRDWKTTLALPAEVSACAAMP